MQKRNSARNMSVYSRENIKFATAKRSIQERGHRGEPTGFCPSENLENSTTKAKELKAAPPVYSFTTFPLHGGSSANIYGCELNFILLVTVFPEPSDGECQEGSHFLYL